MRSGQEPCNLKLTIFLVEFVRDNMEALPPYVKCSVAAREPGNQGARIFSQRVMCHSKGKISYSNEDLKCGEAFVSHHIVREDVRNERYTPGINIYIPKAEE